MIDFSFDPAALLYSLLIPVQILFVNLLLSADNALVIAMACRGLRAEDVQRATMLGIVGAIVLRLVMGSAAIFLLVFSILELCLGYIFSAPRPSTLMAAGLSVLPVLISILSKRHLAQFTKRTKIIDSSPAAD